MLVSIYSKYQCHVCIPFSWKVWWMVANKNWGEVIEIAACDRTMIDSLPSLHVCDETLLGCRTSQRKL